MINPAFGLDQAVPYSLLKACGRLPAKVWTRLELELADALILDRIPDCLNHNTAADLERMLREPIGYAVIQSRAA